MIDPDVPRLLFTVLELLLQTGQVSSFEVEEIYGKYRCVFIAGDSISPLKDELDSLLEEYSDDE